MIRKLFPVVLALFGLGAGIGAGLFLRPPAAPEHAAETEEGEQTEPDAHADSDEEGEQEDGGQEDGGQDEGGPEYVKMNNQFVVPVVEKGRVSAMVVLSVSLEVEAGNTEAVYQREPKLRDVFLQVLFDHANVGGFSGSFTDGSNLVILRTSLKESATDVLGDALRDVLITDIARQDS